jgi:hypothetical protein
VPSGQIANRASTKGSDAKDQARGRINVHLLQVFEDPREGKMKNLEAKIDHAT